MGLKTDVMKWKSKTRETAFADGGAPLSRFTDSIHAGDPSSNLQPNMNEANLANEDPQTPPTCMNL